MHGEFGASAGFSLSTFRRRSEISALRTPRGGLQRGLWASRNRPPPTPQPRKSTELV